MHQVKIEFVLALRGEQNHKTTTILTHGLAHGSCKTISTKQWIELWSQMRRHEKSKQCLRR